MRKRKVILLAALTFVVILMLPLIFNNKGHRHFEAPDLSDIDYSEVFFANEKNDLKLAALVFEWL